MYISLQSNEREVYRATQWRRLSDKIHAYKRDVSGSCRLVISLHETVLRRSCHVDDHAESLGDGSESMQMVSKSKHFPNKQSLLIFLRQLASWIVVSCRESQLSKKLSVPTYVSEMFDPPSVSFAEECAPKLTYTEYTEHICKPLLYQPLHTRIFLKSRMHGRTRQSR